MRFDFGMLYSTNTRVGVCVLACVKVLKAQPLFEVTFVYNQVSSHVELWHHLVVRVISAATEKGIFGEDYEGMFSCHVYICMLLVVFIYSCSKLGEFCFSHACFCCA